MIRLAFLLGLMLLGAAGVMALAQLRARRALQRATLAQLEAIAPAGEAFARRGRRPPKLIAVALARADLPWAPKPWTVGLIALLCGAATLALAGQGRAGALVLLAGLAPPPLWVRRRARINIAAFTRALPNFLDGVRQLLAVGASLQQAVTRAAEGSGPEVRRYLAPVVRRIQNGSSTSEGLAWLAGRLQLGELYMLAAAVQTNARFGGPVSPVLHNLTGLLRDRVRVERELRSATAEVRMTGWVLAGLPPLAALGIFLVNPAYMSFLVGTDQGRTMLTVAVGLQLAGVVVMRRIMSSGF